MKYPVMSYEMSVGLVWLWVACILKLRAMFLNCWRISLVCLALELFGSWVELGFQCRYGGFWMSSCWLMFPGIRSFLVFSSFRFKPPASVFQAYSYNSLKPLHPYCTDDKTSRLMEKRFSAMRDTQRGSQNYMNVRRGRREIEVTRRRRGGINRGEKTVASHQFPLCFPQPGTPGEVHRAT